MPTNFKIYFSIPAQGKQASRVRGKGSTDWLLAALISCFPAATVAQDKAAEDNAQFARQQIKLWQDLYGPVDFSKEELFEVMLYVGPKPLASMQNFAGKQLDPQVQKFSEWWRSKFFLPPLREPAAKAMPSRYYLGGTPVNGPDLLYYEFQEGNRKYSLLENGNMIALSTDNSVLGVATQNQFSREQIATYVHKTVDLPYPSALVVEEQFKLPAKLQVGDVFSNARLLYPQRTPDWRGHIIGIIGPKQITLICFKAPPRRAAAEFEFVPGWLGGKVQDKAGPTQEVQPPMN